MADVKVGSVTLSGTDKKGNAVFRAEGTVDDRAFEAMTIQWKGEPIFKVQEVVALSSPGHAPSLLSLKESQFSRGERIQIARACKAARLETFGEGHKESVEPELKTGETVEIAAKATSNAAGRRLARQKKASKKSGVELHPSGLPMNASISALKRSS